MNTRVGPSEALDPTTTPSTTAPIPTITPLSTVRDREGDSGKPGKGESGKPGKGEKDH